MKDTKKPSELLAYLIELTDQTTEQIKFEPVPPLKLTKYVETSHKVQSYCSITQILSTRGFLPQRSIDVLMKWRADVAKSDFHVTQKMYDANRSGWMGDEWVCRGSKAWRTTPFWIRSDREELDPVNQVLTTAPAFAVAEAALSTGTVQSYEGLNYAVFDLKMPRSEVETWFPLWCTANSDARVRLWFTLEQGLLVRMEAGPFNATNGQGVRMLIQAFACHDERIKIRGPRWINATPAGDGSYRMRKTQYVDIVTHHGEMPEPPEIEITDLKDTGYSSDDLFAAEFLQSYYRSPKSEEEIESFIRAVVTGGHFDDIHAQKTVAPFFAVIFSKYPDRAEEWASEIKNEGAQARVIELSHSIDVLLDDPPSVVNNDECWGAYFASGDKRFLDKLIETTHYASECEDINLLAAGGSAKWSLSSNAERDPTIWTAIESAIADGRDDLHELLTEEPEVFLARMREANVGIDDPNGEM